MRMKNYLIVLGILFLVGLGIFITVTSLKADNKELEKIEIAEVGKIWINKSKYVVGGGRTAKDIENGYFDTSSFVHWYFAQLGKKLGPLEEVSTETLNKIGEKIDISEMQPGDLLFWDTYKKDGHVGIYIGDDQWIGCQFANGVQIISLSNSYWNSKFTGHVRRILD